MTANLTIVTARRDNVLRIPVHALRFVPKGARPDSDSRAAGEHPGQRRVWVAEEGTPKAVWITGGLDDGNNVEVLSSPLREGDPVVTDELHGEAAPRPTGGPGIPRFPR